ncbi:hypothetical protein B9Z55_029090 [Caenorhabditis nigoni]|nr:hypothetical protein B9Z55_029090 [Caenorhabditis nigoni]
METVSLVQSLIEENRTVDEAEKKKNNTTPLTEVFPAEVNHVSSNTTDKPNTPNYHKNHFKDKQHQEKQFKERPRTPYQLSPCLFCLKDHEAFRCRWSPQDKKAAATRNNLCLNCLSNSHQTQQCKSKYSCSVCKNRHHTSICEEKEKFQQMQFKSTAIRDEQNKVYVQFPFNGKEQELKDNYPVAIKRLFALLKQLQNIKDLQAYNEIIQQQLSTGIIEIVPEAETDTGPHYYIPHRVIVKQDSVTTKLRIVLDASSHQKNERSLNDCIFPGPSILKSIVGILLRSRITPYLLIADLEKAFHQVRLQAEHRNVTKFLWLKDISKPATPDNIVTFRFTRIPFGITASPFLLAVTILLYMALNPHPINDKITQNLYVDNVTFTPSTLKEVLADYRASKDVFQKMHMNLREFMCNDKTVMAQIPEEDRAKNSTCKFLGHSWNAEQDTFTIKIAVPPPGRPTKRQLASFQASTFDPLGLISPIVVPIKTLMAKVHETDTPWKSPIPDHLVEEYENIQSTFTEATYTVPRKVTPLNGYKRSSLVIFSDATLEHYAMCAYLRFECNNDTVESRLIFSKSRIRPKNTKNLTIPRMELLGLLIAANAAVTLVDELNIDITSVTFFCDNTSVLHWITHQKSLDKWVQSRVKSIQRVRQILEEKHLQPSFRFVPTNMNPADIATRGETLSELKQNTLWNNGPEYILLSLDHWPQTLEKSPEDPQEFHCFVLGISIPQHPIHQEIPAQKFPEHYTSIVPYTATNSLVKLVTVMQKKMTPQKMTPQTPSGRFCLKNGSLSTFPPPTGSHSKNENSGSGTTLTEQLLNFVHYDKLDIYAAGRLLAQESKKRDIWPEAESFIRKISGTVHEVVHVPRVFDYTNEETMYCIELKDLLKKYQEKPAVKILQMPAISTTILEKIGSMWNVSRCSWKLTDNNFQVSDEWMHGFMTREKNAKKIVKSFMIHILMNVSYFWYMFKTTNLLKMGMASSGSSNPEA